MRAWTERKVRVLCRALIKDLQLPVPASPDDLVSALCARMGDMLGTEVRHHLVAFPTPAVTGLWINDGDVDHVLCEQRASPWHRMWIIAHEFYHVYAHHARRLDLEAVSGDLGFEVTAQTLLPTLTGEHGTAMAKIVAARSHCADSDHERDAELFGLVFSSMVTEWAQELELSVAPQDRTLVGRLEGSFGRRGRAA